MWSINHSSILDMSLELNRLTYHIELFRSSFKNKKVLPLKENLTKKIGICNYELEEESCPRMVKGCDEK